jgi:hypothetical protein
MKRLKNDFVKKENRGLELLSRQSAAHRKEAAAGSVEK